MPTKQLELWLKECSSNTSQLSQIYLPVLRQVLLGTDIQGENDDPLSEEDQLQLLQVLGSIILLATPLPAQALAALLDIEEYDINHWLQNLHAVLNIPSNPTPPCRSYTSPLVTSCWAIKEQTTYIQRRSTLSSPRTFFTGLRLLA